ncbi:putative uncharacterized protein [Bacteroides sp. CAG:927]|jgi:hypothetical protein|nr:putative uncharacterized protein [Bacteroides sp. CAG:927]
MKINKLIAVCALAACVFSASAQISSPYSKFGYGLLNDNATSAQSQMGGVGYAMNSGRQINVMNPASYAAIDSLTFLFDMGVDFTSIKSTDTGIQPQVKEQRYGGGLDYMTLQVPIGHRFGASLGLLPYSSVGYSFGSEIKNGLNTRQGSGGLNQLYLGFGARIIDGLNVGANISYMFGNVVNDVYVATDNGSSSLFEHVTEVRDYHLQFGLQYHRTFGSDHTVGLGLVYSPKKSLLGHAWVVKYDMQADEVPDTLAREKLNGNAYLPETWGGGLSYSWRKRLLVEADFTYQPWSKVSMLKLPAFETTKFADRWKAAFGAQYTHNPRGNYLGRLTTRIGGFYGRDYMMVGANKVNEYGLTVGFGLPTLSSKTIINIGFEWKHRQASPNPMLKENYFSVKLGVNFNELWFFQNKIK